MTDAAPAETTAVPLLEPSDGVPAVVESAAQLSDVVAAMRAGHGPVAVDAERASGYRYGQRAYLVQLRRAGAGTALVDPIACPDLAELNTALADAEWVLHAASQDLPCLAEVGLRPSLLFDTELAGRLAGHPRVGLGPLVESILGLTLKKGHAAADWSTRPLPAAWLRYAALDVEVLVELRDALAEDLRRQHKLTWAREEFAVLAAAAPSPQRVDPWRRTSGLHRVRRPRQLAVIRSLWETRDQLARERDVAPGRVLPDAAIVEAALAMPATSEELAALSVYGGRSTRRHLRVWHGAVERARHLPEKALPPVSPPVDGPPPTRGWAERDQAAAARLVAARAAVATVADEHDVPAENLLAPDAVRRLAWSPPIPATPDSVAEALTTYGARAWQVQLTAALLAEALTGLADAAETDADGAGGRATP
jgi:ribonuclease D